MGRDPKLIHPVPVPIRSSDLRGDTGETVGPNTTRDIWIYYVTSAIGSSYSCLWSG